MVDDGDFKYKNLTDFEKLLFAEKYIKLLKEKVSVLEIELGKANAAISEIDFLSSEEKKAIKQGVFYESVKTKIVKLEKTIRSLKIDNDLFLNKYLIEKQKNENNNEGNH
jgi:hypothetical protein